MSVTYIRRAVGGCQSRRDVGRTLAELLGRSIEARLQAGDTLIARRHLLGMRRYMRLNRIDETFVEAGENCRLRDGAVYLVLIVFYCFLQPLERFQVGLAGRK